jgi:predicted nucleotidyltransferase
MKDLEKLKERIVTNIAYVTNAQKIILFGSTAKDKHDEHSDLDLLIISDNIFDHRKSIIEIKSIIAEYSYQSDVHILTSSEYANISNDKDSFMYKAIKCGNKKIFEKR